MKIMFVADGRSPIALNWIDYFIQSDYEVHLASSFPCQPVPGLASLKVIPLAMSGIYGRSLERNTGKGRFLRKIIPVSLRTHIRRLVAPSSFPRAAHAIIDLMLSIGPDLIHAMRIPFEGMVASQAVEEIRNANPGKTKVPLLISVWGNDFTLHAQSSSQMASFTRRALVTCDALHTDCRRDLILAQDFGFDSTKSSIVLPGGGGVKFDCFFASNRKPSPINTHDRINIINPRGFRAYVCNETVFRAISTVVSRYPNAHFLFPAMEGEAQAQKWAAELGISANVELLPVQTRQEMADLFRKSVISLSITNHDGTPNTLLEAMACGCFPIAGDIESLREWITPAENGLLVNPDDPQALSTAIQVALSQPDLLFRARERNIQLVRERAEYSQTMRAAEEFYRYLIGN